jgi:hypothetical protein
MAGNSSSEAAAGDSAGQMPFHERLLTAVAGHRYQGVAATPGESVRFVREPDNAADPNAIAVHDTAGRRIGYLFREVAANQAGLLDRGLIQLSGRLVAAGEPGYDPDRPMINPPLIVSVHVDLARLQAFVASTAGS